MMLQIFLDNTDSESMSKGLLIRQATVSDKEAITNLINRGDFVHQHLDWRSSLNSIGEQTYLVVEENNKIVAVLACLTDSTNIAWVRLFGVIGSKKPELYWQILFSKIIEQYQTFPQTPIFALAIEEWFEYILHSYGFTIYHQITVLEWRKKINYLPSPNRNSTIRLMTIKDVFDVYAIDNKSFEPIWRLPIDAISNALINSAYATVAMIGEKIAGYQISTATKSSAHLARLGVLPEFQNQSVGSNLIGDLISKFVSLGHKTISVNTQSDNASSLALYQKMGFLETGETFPVFQYDRNNIIGAN